MTRIGKFALALIALCMATSVAYSQPAGSRPQLPLSYRTWQHLQATPALASQFGANLPPVAAEPGPHKNIAGVNNATPTTAWSNLTNSLGYNLGNPLLLTDGTVMVHRTDTREWYKLTPDNTGSYVNGTWTPTALMPVGYGPKFHASAVLPDGRVIVEGGEYNLANNNPVWTNLGAIYDPVADSWTSVTAPSGWSNIGDAQSSVLANKTFFLADCCTTNTALFNPTTLGCHRHGQV